MGNVSHAEIVRIAKKANVELGKVNQGVLNEQMRIANQSAAPLRKVTASALSSNALKITTDTVGSMFPRSQRAILHFRPMPI
ncbi:MAG: hypothetical protein COB29_01215 [Sulfitobacter sp.]|nr:MAG: hypothetical protein COB29_01215 [Sulfitobacter sp.]